MPILGLTPTEYEYYLLTYAEAFELIGQDAFLYPVDVEVKDIYRDPDLLYKKPVHISIIFEESPTAFLRKNNWVIEDDELEPYMAYMVGFDNERRPIEVRENMKVRVVSNLGYHFDKIFNVEKVNLNHLNHFVYSCKLTPYRETNVSPNKRALDKKESSSTEVKYLDIKKL